MIYFNVIYFRHYTEYLIQKIIQKYIVLIMHEVQAKLCAGIKS